MCPVIRLFFVIIIFYFSSVYGSLPSAMKRPSPTAVRLSDSTLLRWTLGAEPLLCCGCCGFSFKTKMKRKKTPKCLLMSYFLKLYLYLWWFSSGLVLFILYLAIFLYVSYVIFHYECQLFLL
ncbi:hypothetical protein FKM82_001439 [Ascaphus truei]